MKTTITTVAEVKAMTVAQLRKVAPQLDIKSASQYKRVELEQLVIDAVVAKTNEQKKATKTAKATAGKKAHHVSDEMVQEMADALTNSIVTTKDVKAEELFALNRKVLIRMMKALHCKRWYRTYDKATMVQLIVGAVMA